MRFLLTLPLLALLPAAAFAQRDAALKSVDRQADANWEAAKQIWNFAEPGYQESRSAKLLADRLEAAGFTVKRGVAKIPTAFTAEFGSGKPVVGIMGEYDALPELSQEAV